MTTRDKYKKMVEGFGPIYEKGKISPKYKGLGPEEEKNIKLEKMKNRLKKKQKYQQEIKNIKHLA